jgi:hypothetical protein
LKKKSTRLWTKSTTSIERLKPTDIICSFIPKWKQDPGSLFQDTPFAVDFSDPVTDFYRSGKRAQHQAVELRIRHWVICLAFSQIRSRFLRSPWAILAIYICSRLDRDERKEVDEVAKDLAEWSAGGNHLDKFARDVWKENISEGNPGNPDDALDVLLELPGDIRESL